MFGNNNISDLIIIFNSNLSHGLVFQSRKLCFSEVLGYCFPSLVVFAYQQNTEFSLIADQIMNFLKANQTPGFARLRLLPHSPPSLAILRQEKRTFTGNIEETPFTHSGNPLLSQDMDSTEWF